MCSFVWSQPDCNPNPNPDPNPNPNPNSNPNPNPNPNLALTLTLPLQGTGGQTRAFFHIQDTCTCIELAVANPPAAG